MFQFVESFFRLSDFKLDTFISFPLEKNDIFVKKELNYGSIKVLCNYEQRRDEKIGKIVAFICKKVRVVFHEKSR